MAVLTDLPLAVGSESDALEFARGVLQVEADALSRVRERLSGSIVRAAELIFRSRGSVIVTGMGKAGIVGQKLAATFASTGTRAFPLHPAEAVHGDLGRIRAGDIVLAVSQSGETEEVLRLIPAIKNLEAVLIAITERAASTLARHADLTIELGPIEEACPLGLAPSASTTAMMAVGDALALLVSRMRDFRPEEFARYHPAGNLGRRLAHVEDVMRTGKHIRVARAEETIRAVFTRLGGARRRTGAIMVVDSHDCLAGIFTDSDLARLFETRREDYVDRPIAESMTRDPVKTVVGTSVQEAIEALQSRKLSELPVVDRAGRPVGLIDLTDLMGLVSPEALEIEDAA